MQFAAALLTTGDKIQEVTDDFVRLDAESDLASNQSWPQVVTTGNVCPLFHLRQKD